MRLNIKADIVSYIERSEEFDAQIPNIDKDKDKKAKNQ